MSASPSQSCASSSRPSTDVARPAPRRAQRLPFAVWMALARATPVEGRLDEAQLWLGDADMPLP